MPKVPVATVIEDAVRCAELTELSAVETDLILHRCHLLMRWCAIYCDLDATLDSRFDANTPSAPASRGENSSNPRAAHAEWFNLQYRLRLIERRADESLGRFLQRYYTSSPPDREEFERVLKSALLPPARVDQFRRLL